MIVVRAMASVIARMIDGARRCSSAFIGGDREVEARAVTVEVDAGAGAARSSLSASPAA